MPKTDALANGKTQPVQIRQPPKILCWKMDVGTWNTECQVSSVHCPLCPVSTPINKQKARSPELDPVQTSVDNRRAQGGCCQGELMPERKVHPGTMMYPVHVTRIGGREISANFKAAHTLAGQQYLELVKLGGCVMSSLTCGKVYQRSNVPHKLGSTAGLTATCLQKWSACLHATEITKHPRGREEHLPRESRW